MQTLTVVAFFLPCVYLLPVPGEGLQPVGNGFLFQGDMVMPLKQIKAAINGGDTDLAAKNTFGLSKDLSKRWPKGVVPYVLADSVKNPILGKMGPTVRAIRSAMKEWEEKTCIRFVKRTNERDYVEFIDGGTGKCYSWVGRGYRRQRISLGFGCFTHGIALHELGHALGLHHEQSRPDRDQYIEIIWDNIEKGNKNQFTKYSHSDINSRGSPYDFDSIMHYEWNAFAKWPWQRTIRAKKSGVSFGQRSHVSVEDAKQINSFYNCPKK